MLAHLGPIGNFAHVSLGQTLLCMCLQEKFVVRVATGRYHTLALMDDGMLFS